MCFHNAYRVKIRIFNWKQYSLPTKDVREKENLRFCRLKFHFCRRPSPNEYQALSLCSLTDTIEDSKPNVIVIMIHLVGHFAVDGDMVIDPTTVTPKELCECGGETITVPLSVACKKKSQ